MSDLQTFGEKAVGREVGIQHAPGSVYTLATREDIGVDGIKVDFANLIDTLNDLRADAGDADVMRMLSLAITDLQTASMWTVKAVTWKMN
jgi:hypothetical protein